MLVTFRKSAALHCTLFPVLLSSPLQLKNTSMHCSAKHCTTEHCTALLSIALTAQHCTALLSTALHYSALLGTTQHCSDCWSVHCTTEHCTRARPSPLKPRVQAAPLSNCVLSLHSYWDLLTDAGLPYIWRGTSFSPQKKKLLGYILTAWSLLIIWFLLLFHI